MGELITPLKSPIKKKVPHDIIRLWGDRFELLKLWRQTKHIRRVPQTTSADLFFHKEQHDNAVIKKEKASSAESAQPWSHPGLMQFLVRPVLKTGPIVTHCST